MQTDVYVTAGGIKVRRTVEQMVVEDAIEPVIDALDGRRGVLLASSYEYPGRYTRWDMGFVDPPLGFTGRDRSFTIRALNARGIVLLGPLEHALSVTEGVASVERRDDALTGTVAEPSERLPEEQRSRQPTLFTVLRSLVAAFSSPDDPH